MTGVAVLVGNPKRASRTRDVAELLGTRIAALRDEQLLPVVDLADHTDTVFHWPSTEMDELGLRIRGASVAVIASPTYKASYTGLLKAFLDRYQAGDLKGVIAVPLFTIGSPHHSLAVEFTLRPLLVELGASIPTRGISFETSKYEDREAILSGWIEKNARALTAP